MARHGDLPIARGANVTLTYSFQGEAAMSSSLPSRAVLDTGMLQRIIWTPARLISDRLFAPRIEAFQRSSRQPSEPWAALGDVTARTRYLVGNRAAHIRTVETMKRRDDITTNRHRSGDPRHALLGDVR